MRTIVNRTFSRSRCVFRAQVAPPRPEVGQIADDAVDAPAW